MGLYYQPEGYFGPVCDVPMTAQDTYVPPTVEAPPPPEDCIVPYFCDHDDYDDGSADPPRYFCKKDENGDYYGCYVLGPTTPTTLGDPYTIPPEGDWPIESPQGHDLPGLFFVPPVTPAGCYPFDSDVNIRPITITKADGSTVTKYARNRSNPVTYNATSTNFWSEKANQFAVWVNPMVCTLPCLQQTVTYEIKIPATDTYVVEFGCDDNGKVFIGDDPNVTPLITKAGGMFKGGALTAPATATHNFTEGVNKVTVQVTNGNATEVVQWQHARAQTQTIVVRKSTVPGANNITTVNTLGRGEQESDADVRGWYFSHLSSMVAKEYFSGRFGRTGSFPNRGRPPDIGMNTWINHYLGQAGTTVNDNPLLATQWANTKLAITAGYAAEALEGDIVAWYRSSCSVTETLRGLPWSPENEWAQDWDTNPGGWYMQIHRGAISGVGLPNLTPFSDRDYGFNATHINSSGNWDGTKISVPGYDGDKWFANTNTTTHTASGFTINVTPIVNGTQEDGSVMYDSEWWISACPHPSTLIVGQEYNISFNAGGTDNVTVKIVIGPGTEIGNLGWTTSGPHSFWGSFLNTYGVWPSRTETYSGQTKTLDYYVTIPETGNYSLQYAADNTMSITFDGTALTLSPTPDAVNDYTITFAATKGRRKLTMAVGNLNVGPPNTDTWSYNPAGGAWKLTRAGSSGTVAGTFAANGNFVTTGTGTAQVTFGFSWNDSQTSYGTALGTYAIPELGISFTQGTTQTGSLANQTAIVEGGKTYTCQIVGGNSAGFGITNSNQNICFYDGHNTDCNATLTSSVSNTETVIHHSGMMDVEISDSMIWHTRMASGYEYYEQTT